MHQIVPTRRFGVLAWWLSCLILLIAPPPGSAGVSATGVDGVKVSLDDPAERIVSLAPHVTELLFTAEAGDRLVGAVEHSDYPPAAKKVPRVGDAFRIDLERITSLEPDLVVAWESGNPADAVTSLRELGIPVLVTEVHRLDDIPDLLSTLGELAGSPDPARKAAASFREEIDELRKRYSDRALRLLYTFPCQ
jgi:iron complex transport system substrate-binding protein